MTHLFVKLRVGDEVQKPNSAGIRATQLIARYQALSNLLEVADYGVIG